MNEKWLERLEELGEKKAEDLTIEELEEYIKKRRFINDVGEKISKVGQEITSLITNIAEFFKCEEREEEVRE